MISVEKACSLIMEHVPSPRTERVPLEQATGRILKEPVKAERDMPPFDRVMMDGYSFRFQKTFPESFEVKGIALAGHPPPALTEGNHCIEVTTGAPLPPGSDTIVPVEDCLVSGKEICLRKGVKPHRGRYIHVQGSDGKAGQTVLPEGIFLGPAEMAVAATEGVSTLAVATVPSICLVTTGDEVVTDGSLILPEQIRGSHTAALGSLFKVYPGLEFSSTHASDNEDDLRAVLKQSLDRSSILLITGGVSRGRKDLVPGILEELGVKKAFHRVSQRPGQPLWFGSKGETLVFGLPGNPISTLVCTRRYVFPVLEKWMGRCKRFQVNIPVSGPVDPSPEMVRFLPVLNSANGMLGTPFATSGSLQNLAGTEGFIEVPAGESLPDVFNYYPWSSR